MFEGFLNIIDINFNRETFWFWSQWQSICTIWVLKWESLTHKKDHHCYHCYLYNQQLSLSWEFWKETFSSTFEQERQFPVMHSLVLPPSSHVNRSAKFDSSFGSLWLWGRTLFKPLTNNFVFSHTSHAFSHN